MRFLAVFLFAVTLSACNGGNDDHDPITDFNGTWDIRYNFIDDGCGIAQQGVLGFVDIHEIEQQDNAVLLSGTSQAGDPLVGEISEEGTFTVQRGLEGDLLGDGSFCTFSEQITYQSQDDVSATSNYLRKLECTTGACTSSAIGSSVIRQ